MSDGYQTVATIGDREVAIRELTVKEIRNVAKDAVTNGENDFLANSLVQDAPFSVLAAFTDIEVSDLEDWRPSEIRALRDKCQEVNPDFFDMNRRLDEALRLATTQSDSLTETLPE